MEKYPYNNEISNVRVTNYTERLGGLLLRVNTPRVLVSTRVSAECQTMNLGSKEHAHEAALAMDPGNEYPSGETLSIRHVLI